MSIYSKNLSGVNQKVIVGTATYTAQTTYANFLSAAAEGEVGVFLDTGAVRTAALTAGQKFFVAQKRDGNVNKTPVLSFDDIFRKLRTAYSAPVKKVMTVGYDQTTNNFNFDFTGASATNTLTVGLVARDLTPGNQPFPVQEGYATVNSTTADQYTVLGQIVSQFNGELDYERVFPDKFCVAEILSDGSAAALTGTATVISVTNLSNYIAPDGTVTNIAVGTLIEISNVLYKVTAIGLGSGNDFTIDRKFQGATNATLAVANLKIITYTSGTTKLGVRLTASTTDNIFTANGFGPGVSTAVVATSTAWVQGSGAGAQIALLESIEGIIFDGVNSTRNVAFREDYGQPSLFAVAATTYDQIFVDLKPLNIPAASLPFYEQRQIERVLIACPVGGTLNSTLQTVFGV